MQKKVIMCYFVSFGIFRAKGHKLLNVIFLSRSDGKQRQNDRILCAKDLGEKCS